MRAFGGLLARRIAALLAVAALAGGPSAATEGASQGPWQRLEPGPPTRCADGSAYRFFARQGDPARLLIHFQGGGACWTGEHCDPHLDPTYKMRVAQDEPARYGGIFDFANPENPFREHSVVLVPYCSGDVHLGDRQTRYRAPARPGHPPHGLAIAHRGGPNAATVLAWIRRKMPAPERIFVSGSSAGAIASPYYAARLATDFPEARVVQLADAAGGYRWGEQASPPHTSWGALAWIARSPAFAGLQEDDFRFTDLFIRAARRHPRLRLAAYDTAEDAVQRRFLRLAGQEPASLLPWIHANHVEIRAEVERFHTFLAAGDAHTVLGRPAFYTERADGVRLRDWVADLASGHDVPEVRCQRCGLPASHEP